MKQKNLRQTLVAIAVIAALALVSTRYFFRIDLTFEKRYTLSNETKKILNNLQAPVHANIYLDGELPRGFRQLRSGIREMLDEFKTYAGKRLTYSFINPVESVKKREMEKFYAGLREIGLRDVTVHDKNKDGTLTQQRLFPGATLAYKDRMLAVNFLSDNRTLAPDMVLNASLEALEYELISNINALTADSIGQIAFLVGQGEPGRAALYDLGSSYATSYNVDFKRIDGDMHALDNYKAVVVVKPTQAFDERDKYVLDQYLMRGGKLMWLVDGVNANPDSLASERYTFALANNLNLDDQLFTYGVRVNPDLVQDIYSNPIVITTADGSGKPVPAPWLYYPLATPSPASVITRNLNPVWLRYASTIDTVGAGSGICKTALLRSSAQTHLRGVPAMIRLDEVSQPIDGKLFNRSGLMCAVLLEGRFPSFFRSRNARSLFPESHDEQLRESVETKMIVVSDGDIAINDTRHTAEGEQPSQALGYDRYSGQTFGNKDFLVNALNYLTDDAGLMQLRNREFKLRLLDKQKVADESLKWQMVNVALPLLLWTALGIGYGLWRRRRYSRQDVIFLSSSGASAQ